MTVFYPPTDEAERSVAESRTTLIACLDRDGVIEVVNPAWKRFDAGRAGTSLLRGETGTHYLRACRAAAVGGDAPARAALPGLEEVFSGARPQLSLEYDCETGEGMRSFLLDATPLLGGRGGVIISLRDITAAKQSDAEDRTRLEERKRAAVAQRLLAEAGVTLAASLDHEETLRSVARLVVPDLADFCTVHLVDDGGRVYRVAAVHADPALEARWQELPPDRRLEETMTAAVREALRRGESLLFPVIPPENVARLARNEAHLALLRALAPGSMMIAPLVARGRTIGAIIFVASQGRRPYDRADLALAEDLAHRAALAADNARLFQEAEQVKERFRYQLDFSLSLTNNLRSGICAVDREGRVTFMNPAAEQILGWSESELLGRDLFESVQVRRADGTARSADEGSVFDALAAGRAVRNDDENFTRKGGTTFPAGYTVSAIAPGGTLSGAVIAFRDITEQKRMEEALRISERRFRSLVQNASDIIVVLDREGILQYISPSARQRLGYDPETWSGRDVFALIHPDDVERLREAHARVVEAPGVYPPLEFRLRHADGSWRHMETTANNLLDDPSVRGVVQNVRDISERKLAEEALVQLASLVESSDDAIVGQSPDGVILSWNRGAERLYGYTADEVTGRSAEILLAPDRMDEEADILERIGRGERIEHYETVRQRKDGSLIHVSLTISPVKDETGAITGAASIARDITERKRVEEALWESERRFRSLVQNASDVIMILGAEGQVRYLSPSVERVLGYRRQHITSDQTLVAVHPEDLPRVRQFYMMAATNPGMQSPVEIRLRHADGSWRYMEALANNLLADPSVRGIVVNARDITERKEAEAALERIALESFSRKMELEGILTHLGDGIMVADTTGRVTLMNPAACAILAVTEDDAEQGRAEAEYWHAVTPDGATVAPQRLPLARALAGERGPAYDVEVLVHGEARIISVSAAPLTTATGALHGAVAVLRDVTNVRRTQERVTESERLRSLGEMASGVAHDFNNLLAVILGRAELLIAFAERTEGGAKLAPHLDVLKQAAEDGAETVKRLQAFSGVSRAAPEEAMDLAAVVRAVVEFARPRWKDAAQQRGITIRMETEIETVPLVQGSPAELREVLLNLVFNAVDAMPHGGTIHVGVNRHDDKVHLQVQDSGIGMSEAVRRRIFEPFFTTKGTHGAGLGLSMSYGIIARMGGHISVESTVNVGTTFTIVLPYRLAQDEDPRAEGGESRPLRVLLVDDEVQMLRTAQLLLELDEHDVLTVGGGGEALGMLQNAAAAGADPFDVVLTDLGMPGMNGLQLVAAIRAAGFAMPCVLVTGWGLELTDDDVAGAGAQAVLPKPFSAAQLRATLRSVAGTA